MPKPAAFLSYAHRDDDYHDGAITRLRAELGRAISVATGEDFEIFQDRKDIAWGEHWPSKLEEGVAGGRFLIAILSPSFFKSDHCRKELTEFMEIERASGRNDLILPIYYVATPLIENPLKQVTDPLANAIAQRQYRDWRDLRHEPYNAPKVRRKLDSLAEELVQALERSSDEHVERPSADRAAERTPGTELSGSETRLETRELVEAEPTEIAGAAQKHNGRRHADLMLPDPVAIIGKAQPPRETSKSNRRALPEPGTVFRDIDEPWCPEMVVIRSGTFRMGSPSGEAERHDDEGPQHRVKIEKPFVLGRYPVTFEEFDHFTEVTGRERADDAGWGRGRRPVINIDVEDAEDYLAWLSGITGRPYRLPSEAEWEYACRAQTTTPFWTGATITTDQANYDGNHRAGERNGVWGFSPSDLNRGFLTRS